MTMKIKEYPKGLGNKLLANGTWEGAFGMIQRGEIDVDSTGNGINLERTILLDFPICTHRVISRLIAGKPEGNSLFDMQRQATCQNYVLSPRLYIEA